MKLILTLFITWALLPTGGSLQCLTCNLNDQPCANPVSINCTSPDQLCLSVSATGNIDSNNFTQQFKGCTPPSLCITPAPATLSVNVEFTRVAASVSCCNTDDCNNQNLAVPSSRPNGRCCSSCSSPVDTVCNNTLACLGNEDRCLNGTVTVPGTFQTLLRGCASINVCALLPDIQSFLTNASSIVSNVPVLPSSLTSPLSNAIIEASCNTAPSTGQMSVVLLPVWLTIFVKLIS